MKNKKCKLICRTIYFIFILIILISNKVNADAGYHSSYSGGSSSHSSYSGGESSSSYSSQNYSSYKKEEQRNKELQEEKNNINSTKTIEQTAKEKLGNYLPNERVYIDISKDSNNNSDEINNEKKSIQTNTIATSNSEDIELTAKENYENNVISAENNYKVIKVLTIVVIVFGIVSTILFIIIFVLIRKLRKN